MTDNLIDLETLEREQHREAAAQSQYELLSLGAVAAMAPPTYLIDKLITTTGLATIFGAPGTGKSFVALDMAMCTVPDRVVDP